MAEKEILEEDTGSKLKAYSVFFISLLGVNERGIVGIYEYIFDIYTKACDFHESHVKVVTAQDLLTFFILKNKGAEREDVDIYSLDEYFIQHHQHGHFVLDECPFLLFRGNLNIDN